MKTFVTKLIAGAGLMSAVAMAFTAVRPVDTAAYSLLGGNLGLTQRDFRVFNNFTNSQANNNLTPHANFPGHTGAVMAIWKGHVEWASGPYAGNGLGDGVTSNPVLGSGGANFDNTFQGTANTTGGTNDNIHSLITQTSGGTLAYCETPISDGWRIRYLSNWTWQDGPGSVSSGTDLQGVACHEIGHSLGLGHTNVGGGQTMWPSISGTGTAARSIESDDIAGVRAIYGVKSATKPTITSLTGSKTIGELLTINGSQFSTSGNEVWFTALNSNGNPVKVTSVNSTGGGTVINVTIPGGVVKGEVLVKKSGTGHAVLSNAFPIDLGAGPGDPPALASINPSSGPAGGFTNVVLTGSGFNGTTSVTFGGVPAEGFTVINGTTINAVTPPGALFSAVTVQVTDPDGTSSLPNGYVYSFNPAPSISSVDPSSGPLVGGTVVVITGSSVVGVTDVQFDGISGSGLEILSSTQLQVTTPAGVATGSVNVTAFGSGNSTIVGGFDYINLGQFVDIGPGTNGAFGVPPILTGVGDLTPGSLTGFTLQQTLAFPGSNAILFVSLSEGAAPFKCGLLYPLPILFQVSLTMDFFGGFSLPAQIPVGTPSGASFTMQTWTADILACGGLAGSNGLKCIIP